MLIDELHAKEAIAFALHVQVRPEAFRDIDNAARAFGLRPLGEKWRSIDRDTASRILYALLIEDMAFSSPRMADADAKAASEEFLSQFGADRWFFTNGNWEAGWTKLNPGGTRVGLEWEPATGATFDGGVIVLGRSRSGVLWLEDED